MEPLIRIHKDSDHPSRGDADRLEFPDAARFDLSPEGAAEAITTVNTTLEAVADVSVGTTVVANARIGGGVLLIRRGRQRVA